MAINRPATYGPPYYDVSRKANMALRKSQQAKSGKPSPMYSSDWYGFRSDTLQGDKVLERKLHQLAIRASFALKRRIPLGDKSSDGHIRNAVKVQKVLRGGMYSDRTVFHVHAGGGSKTSLGKWHSALYRSTYTDAESFRNRRLGQTGPRPSWLKQAERDVTGG